jgi:hypothetical protein
VLIIENNCGLSEAFLNDQNATNPASPESEKKIVPGDEGGTAVQRFIEYKQLHFPRVDHLGQVAPSTHSCAARPALFALCAVPVVSPCGSSTGASYEKFSSGAEGTIIEEPDNLPRVIWGLDSEEHHFSDFGSDSHLKKQDSTAHQSHHARHSPRHYKPSNDSSAASTRTHTSVVTMLSPRRGRPEDAGYGTLRQVTSGSRTDVAYSPNPFNETIVLENLVDRRTVRAAHQDQDYDAIGDLKRTLEHNLHLRESDNEPRATSNLDRNILSRAYGSRNSLSSSRSGLPAMRVSSRPAVGSALPQILIEPRSPEVPQAPSRRMTAMELAHQYQQHQLLKMQQQSLLPTPPNSSSPLWSSEFSPYNHPSVSPASLRHQVFHEPLRDSDTQDQLRHLMRERFGRNILHDADVSSLAPAAQINSASRLEYPGYDLDPVTSQTLTNIFAAQDIQHLPSLPSDALLPIARAPQTLPGYINHDSRRYAVPHHDIVSPTSPEEFRYTRGHSQPQILRSIPLARLMQRRLSSVPEEDSSPTIHGRSPSPPQITRQGADRSYLYPPAPHGYQYPQTVESSANYSGSYVESASRGSQGKLRGAVFSSKISAGSMDALDAQGRYRTRHEGVAPEKEGAITSRRATGLKKTRGRPPKFHGN